MKPSAPDLTSRPVYVQDKVLGHRQLGWFPIGRDLSHLQLVGLSFPSVIGREVEGGGVIAERGANAA